MFLISDKWKVTLETHLSNFVKKIITKKLHLKCMTYKWKKYYWWKISIHIILSKPEHELEMSEKICEIKSIFKQKQYFFAEYKNILNIKDKY